MKLQAQKKVGKKVFTTWAKGAWTPRRRGDVYCSPACGGNCKYTAYLLAKERAHALCMMLGDMCGGGWKMEIRENLGWYYTAISRCERIRVSGSHFDGAKPVYVAFLGSGGYGGNWVSEHHKDPRKAVKEAIANAKAELAEMTVILKGL